CVESFWCWMLHCFRTPACTRCCPLSLHDALPILERWGHVPRHWRLGEAAEATVPGDADRLVGALDALLENAVAHTGPTRRSASPDRKSTRLNSSHVKISYAVFCLKKKKPTY